MPHTVKMELLLDIKFVTLLAYVKIIDTQIPLRIFQSPSCKNYHLRMLFANTFELPNHSSVLELLLENVYKYFQLPNNSSLPELPFKSDVYQYFQNPKPQ